MFKTRAITCGALQSSFIKKKGAERIPKRRKLRPAFLKAPTSTSYVQFGGTNEYIEYPADQFNLTNGDFTLSAWFKVGTSGSNYLIGKYYDGSDSWVFSVADTGGSGQVVLFNSEVGGVGKDQCTYLTGSITPASWNHVSISADRSVGTNGFTVYVNGNALSVLKIANTTTTANLSMIEVPSMTGRSNTSYSTAYTTVADLRYYNTTITAGQASSLYKDSFTKRENAAGLKSNLVDWYSFGDFSEDSIRPGVSGGNYTSIGSVVNWDEKRRTKQPNTFIENDGTSLTGWSFSEDPSGVSIDSGKIKFATHGEVMSYDANVVPGFRYKLTMDYTDNDTGSSSITPFTGTVGGKTLTYGTSVIDGSSVDTTKRVVGNTFFFYSTNISSGVSFIDNIALVELPTYGGIPLNMESGDFKRVKLKGGRIA